MKHISEYLEELFQERAGMIEYLAGYPREEAEARARVEVETYRQHRCEVLTIVNRYFPHGDPKPFFEDVQKHRGKVAADKLRDDCRAEWIKRKEHGA